MRSSLARWRPFLLVPIGILVLLFSYVLGYVSAAVFLQGLLVLLVLVLMAVTVRLVLERDKRLHDKQKDRSGSTRKK